MEAPGLAVNVPGITANPIASLGYEIVVLSTKVRHKNSFRYVKK